MFSKLISTTKWCSDVISIDDLISLIKEPKQIDYSDYNNYKVHSALAYKAHGVFEGLGKADIIQFSNFLFFDIDGVQDLESTKQDLADAGATLIYKSLSGKGIHFLVELNFKVKDINDFEEVYASYFDYYKRLGFNLDNNAKGLNRGVVIGFDNEPLYTGRTNGRLLVSKGIINSNKEERIHIKANDTLEEIIYKTKIDIDKDTSYIVKEVNNYYEIYLPNDIPDGQKHIRYKAAIVVFTTLNPLATIKDIKNWLMNVNDRQNVKMDKIKLFNLVENTYKWIKKEGIKAYGRKKLIHFQSNSKLTTKEKQSIAAKEIAKIKSDKTLNKIKQFMIDNNYKPTQKEVANALKLGIATIKRYWKEIK